MWSKGVKDQRLKKFQGKGGPAGIQSGAWGVRGHAWVNKMGCRWADKGVGRSERSGNMRRDGERGWQDERESREGRRAF